MHRWLILIHIVRTELPFYSCKKLFWVCSNEFVIPIFMGREAALKLTLKVDFVYRRPSGIILFQGVRFKDLNMYLNTTILVPSGPEKYDI